MQRCLNLVDLVSFHFSVSPHAPFLNLLFEQIAYSNEYLLAKFGFDTAENEPCKVCPLSAYRIITDPPGWKGGGWRWFTSAFPNRSYYRLRFPSGVRCDRDEDADDRAGGRSRYASLAEGSGLWYFMVFVTLS